MKSTDLDNMYGSNQDNKSKTQDQQSRSHNKAGDNGEQKIQDHRKRTVMEPEDWNRIYREDWMPCMGRYKVENSDFAFMGMKDIARL